MSADHSRRSRLGSKLIALAAVAATSATIVAPAAAAPGEGSAAIKLANHNKGRTLSGQGVEVLANAPATKQAQTLALPISDVDAGAQASAKAESSLVFKLGKKSVTLNNARFDLSGGNLVGTLGKEEIPVFKLGATPAVNGVGGTVALTDGKLRLTAEAAKALKKSLGLDRALRHDGVGMVWLNARVGKAVISGSAQWGILASWRNYVLSQFGPPSSIGTITTEGGATTNGDMKEANGFFSFPAGSGRYEKGLNGAADKLSLNAQGSAIFTKVGHCIIEVRFSGLEILLDGASSKLITDLTYDVDTPAGKTCVPQPPVSSADVPFATLDLSAIAPIYSSDGKTITWTAIPASLTAAGSTAFLGGKYPEGQVLDPITISVGVG